MALVFRSVPSSAALCLPLVASGRHNHKRPTEDALHKEREHLEAEGGRAGVAMEETYHKVEISSKEGLMNEAPPVYSASPRLLPGLPCKKSLLIVVVVVVVVLIVLGFLLMGLHITQKHTETVLQMTIQGLDGEGSPQHLSMSRKERLATFHVSLKANASATVVYDFNHLLVGYRTWPGRSCSITKMNKENLQGLDAVVQTFQHVQPRLVEPEREDMEDLSKPLADRSILGTTINILCSSVPIYWA